MGRATRWPSNLRLPLARRAQSRYNFVRHPTWGGNAVMASQLQITVNGRRHPVEAAPDTPLLYVLRSELNLNGPKFGCGLADTLTGRFTPHHALLLGELLAHIEYLDAAIARLNKRVEAALR